MFWLAKEMDKTRVARRSTMAASNGASRRRQRAPSIRGSLEEDGRLETQKRARSRDRVEKKDRDLLNRSQRRRVEKFTRRNREEEEERGSDGSMIDEDECGSTRTLPLNPGSPQQNHFRSTTSCRSARLTGPVLKVVEVPRKARSASVKRSHEHWTSSCEDRRASASPGSHSFDAGSPSSSNVSVKQKMKPIESRTPFLYPPHSCSTHGDLEIEIAEVLGQMKQSRGSKNEANAELSGKACEFHQTDGFSFEGKPSLDLSNCSESKKIKKEAEDMSGQNGSYVEASAIKVEAETAVSLKQYVVATSSSVKPREEIKMNKEPDLLMKDSNRQKSATLAKLDGCEDMTVNKMVSAAKDQFPREEKFKIDLMAPPSMPSSPERENGSHQMASEPNSVGHMSIKRSVKENENVAERKGVANEGREKMMENRELLTLDLEIPSRSCEKDGNDTKQNHISRQSQLPLQQQVKVDNSAQSVSIPSPLAVGGCPSGLSPVGYIPPFQAAIVPADESSGTFKTLPAAPITPAQPGLKRCATHYYIARNIQFHQRFMKTNHFFNPNAACAPFYSGARSNSLYVLPLTESRINGKLSQGNLPLAYQSTANDKSATFTEIPVRKQPLLPQAPLPPPAPSTNLVSGATLIFPMNHHQQPIAAANQSAPAKSVPSSNHASLTNQHKSGVSAMNFNYPNVSSSEASYLTVLPNSGYPYPVSISTGAQPAGSGLNSAQALAFSNNSYAPHLFHRSQSQQQQAHQNHTSRGTLGVTQTGGNSSLKAITTQKQHSQKQHLSSSQSQRVDAEKSACAQSLTVPMQPWNFASMSSMSHSEKRQNAQQSTQAFAMSFASSSSLNFSSIANGYHIMAASQASQKKADGKNVGSLSTTEYGRKVPVGKSNGQTLVFDNSSRNLSFVSSAINGNWPRPVSASSVPASAPIPVPSSRSKPVSSVAIKFQNSPAQASSQWKNSVRSSVQQAPTSGTCNAATVKNVYQHQQGRGPSQTQISFVVNQQMPPSQSYSSPLMESPRRCASDSNTRTNSGNTNKVGIATHATTQSQQTENSAAGSGKKSSPVCGRNVPSIIGSCPSHLSGLKY